MIFPEAGLTKGDLADYYARVAPLMLEFAARRPVSLVRCPEGTAKDCFFQKHGHKGLGPHVHRLPIREKSGEVADYIYLDDAAGILECIQLGTIEFHGWASLAGDLEHPERMVFDLDPDVGLGFSDVKRAARLVRKLLAERGLESFAMLTGGKGVHVVAPLAPFVGGAQQLRQVARRGDGGRRAEALHRDDEQGQAQGEDFRRLAQERARLDRDCALFGARAPDCACRGAGELGRAGPHPQRAPLYHPRCGQADRTREWRSTRRLGPHSAAPA